MATSFLSTGVWAEITAAVKNSQRPCHVAVAYFGQGASKRLPLPEGSHLVVNASEANVTSGSVDPRELLKLVNRGVRVYNAPALHAKVFVIGRTAYIGSTNVSENSANNLVEAAIRTTDSGVLRDTREFIARRSRSRLGPKALEKLAEIYRDPVFTGGPAKKKAQKRYGGDPETPRLFLAQMELRDRSELERNVVSEGQEDAKKERKHPRIWECDDFPVHGACPYQKGDQLIRVTDFGDGKFLVDGPAAVYDIHGPKKEGREVVSAVFLEFPKRRRKSVQVLAKAIGFRTEQLRRDGRVQNRKMAEALIEHFENG